MSRWITVKAERALYADRGCDVILCDRNHHGPVTLVLKLSDETLHDLARQAIEQSTTQTEE